MTAHLNSSSVCLVSRMCFSKVVFPEPRNPQSRVTGTRDCSWRHITIYKYNINLAYTSSSPPAPMIQCVSNQYVMRVSKSTRGSVRLKPVRERLRMRRILSSHQHSSCRNSAAHTDQWTVIVITVLSRDDFILTLITLILHILIALNYTFSTATFYDKMTYLWNETFPSNTNCSTACCKTYVDTTKMLFNISIFFICTILSNSNFTKIQ